MSLLKKKALRRQLSIREVKLTQKDVDKIKRDATANALKVVIGFSLFALRDEFGFGKARLLKFYKRFFEINDAYNKNYLNMDDIWETLTKETGIKFEDGRNGDN